MTTANLTPGTRVAVNDPAVNVATVESVDDNGDGSYRVTLDVGRRRTTVRSHHAATWRTR